MHFNSIEEVIADELFLAWYFKSNDEKAQEWEHWLLQHQDYVPLIKQSIALLNELDLQEAEVSTTQVEAAYQKLQYNLDAAPVVEMKPKNKRWWIPAAAVLILLIGGIAFWNSMNSQTKLTSRYGSIKEYKLPDGSQVTLNANSTIAMSKEWEQGKDREVWLKGEAFFHVQKTPLKNKFIVHADKMDIIVTGTQFNVVSREDESSVLLTEGSVIIKTPDGKELHMKPGDFVKIENNIPALKPADQEKILAWKQSKLDFENTPISEVAKIITRHYGVKVNITDSTIANTPISGVMPNDNLDVLIEALKATGEFRISKENNEIVISGL